MKKDVMQAVADTGILPVINITDINDAEPLARAILGGGVKALEITLRSEVSLEAIRKLIPSFLCSREPSSRSIRPKRR